MKKLFAIILTLALVLSMAAVPAFADENEVGSITINGVGANATYEIYKILKLDNYSTEGQGRYSYILENGTADAWYDFFETGEGKNYISFHEENKEGYAVWIGGDSAEAVVDFSKLALEYAKAKGIDPVKSSANDGEFVITGTSGKFSDLELGYYLVDSDMGALCGLTTTNPDAAINAKNGIPTIDKQVKEDSTEQWGDKNTADIGQTVEYRVTINVHAGAQNYVLHDTMSEGLTFNKDSVEVEHIIPGDKSEYATKGTDYTVVTEGMTDGCTFEVRFTKEFCDHLETNDKVVVTYNAMLNRNAIVAEDGNANNAKLDYGEGNTTTFDSVTTKTFGIDIIKTDSQNTLIPGAKFKIYDAATGGNEVAVVLMDDGVTYRRARADEPGVEIEVKNGQVRIDGFDNGTYYLEETEAPAGYNKLTSRQKFIISDANLDAVFNGTIYSTGSGVHVVNNTGAMLPETGGFGTTMFIILGGLAVMAAGIFLFVNKRMSQIAE